MKYYTNQPKGQRPANLCRVTFEIEFEKVQRTVISNKLPITIKNNHYRQSFCPAGFTNFSRKR